jgi:hypothetical protein
MQKLSLSCEASEPGALATLAAGSQRDEGRDPTVCSAAHIIPADDAFALDAFA